MNTNSVLLSSLYQRSSLYGASLVASEFDDSNIIVWGPRGCTSQVLDAMHIQRQQFDYYHFAVTESDILTNGSATLKDNILPFVEGCINKGPLFLFLGDATQLTSEDVESLVNSHISSEFPIIFTETGFKGDLYYGINETLYKLFKRLCKTPKSKDSKLINLIPEVGLSPQWRSDALEVTRILELLGFKVNIVPNRSSIEEVSKITEAGLTILLNKNVGKKAADYLKEEYNIPVFEPSVMPIGLLGTKLWLKELYTFLGDQTLDINTFIEEQEEIFYVKTRPALREENYNVIVNKMRLSNFVIFDEPYRAAQWVRVLKEELNFAGGYHFSTMDNPGIEISSQVKCIDSIPELIEKSVDEETALVLGSDWLNVISENSIKDKLVVINNPVVKKITLEANPYMGFRGMVFMLQDILNTIEY